MKKKYRKPMACIERFDIVQTGVGRDCWDNIIKEDVNFNDFPCTWDVAGIKVFNTQTTNSACEWEGEGLEGVCYNNPAPGFLMFRS